MLLEYKVFFIALIALLVVIAIGIFVPRANWKCPAGSGLVSGMCVPGATAPVREWGTK